MRQKLPCKLSDIAEQDVSTIYDYTAAGHGANQAVQYLKGIDACLDALASHPKKSRERPEIRNGLRSLPYQHHVIFYRIHDHYIRIVRILHKSRDMPRHLRGQND